MWNTSGPCKQLFVCVTLAVFIIIGYFAILRNDQISVVGGYLMDYNSNYEPSNSTYSQEYNLNERKYEVKSRLTNISGMLRFKSDIYFDARSLDVDIDVLLPGEPLPPIPHLTTTKFGTLGRPMSNKDYDTCKRLLGFMANIFDRYNITWFMSDGTLLGSYLFHDILPWDDDIDVRVDAKDYSKLKKVVYQNPSLRRFISFHGWGDRGNEFSKKELNNIYPVYTGKEGKKRQFLHRHKWFFTNQKKTFNYPWRWPFVDIFLMKADNTSLCTVDPAAHEYCVNINDAYPRHYRPLAGMWLPVPRNPRLFLEKKYKKFRCKSHIWSHIKESGNKPSEKDCHLFDDIYPHTRREEYKHGIIEELVLGEETLYKVFLDERLTGSKEPYSIN